jgi:DNA-binding HxlR family transcriptional regulator
LIRAIGTGHARFNELAKALASATPRAISQGLQTLTTHDLVLREVRDGRPPASQYCLTPHGKVIARAF